MKNDFRLLLPAVGIWSGAFGQSLLINFHAAYKFIFGLSLICLFAILRRKILSVFVGACLIGALIFSIHQSALQRGFFADHVDEVVQVRAKLTSDVREIHGQIRGDYRQRDRFLAEVKSIAIDEVHISVPLLLFGDQDLADLTPGDQIQVLARVEIFTGYSTFAGSLTQIGEIKLIRQAPLIWRWTSSIRSDINKSLQDLPEDARALIPGLIIGDRSGQDAELSSAMRRSGLTHLTAVSGANFAIVASLLMLIGRGLRIRGRTLWAGIALILLLFIFLVRPSSSVLRAAVMTGVLLLAKARGVRASPVPALAAAISLLLLINPFYVRDAGFALSVFATAGLLFLAPVITEWLRSRLFHQVLAEALAIPISATIFCLPVIVLLSGELSLISVFANFLVAPVIALITVSGVALMMIAPISTSAGAIVGWIITPFALWITLIARTLSALPFAALQWPQSWIGSVAALGIIVVVFALVRAKKRVLRYGVMTIFFLQILMSLNPLANSWIPDDWLAFQCDVGQGDGMVIRTGDHYGIVIDVGPDENAIDSCLRSLGITRIDLLILTHFHADHVAGLAGVLKGRVIERAWISQTREPSAEAKVVEQRLGDIQVEAPKVSDEFREGAIAIRVIAVAANVSPNDSSIAIVANINGMTVFAAGDLELAGQARALTALRRIPVDSLWDRSPIDVMKGIHHGSALQDPALIGFLRPRLTIFSVGAENPYGHPSQSALDLYGRYGAVLRTDQDRSIALAKRGGNLIVVAAPTTPWAL